MPSSKSKRSQSSMLILLFNKRVYFTSSSSTALYKQQIMHIPSLGKSDIRKDTRKRFANAALLTLHWDLKIWRFLSTEFQIQQSYFPEYSETFWFHSILGYYYFTTAKSQRELENSLNHLWCQRDRISHQKGYYSKKKNS